MKIDRRNLKGFTLIELMIVVLIIGLIAAIAYPQYQVLSRANLRETSRKLAGTINYLYARAIIDKKPWRLAFDAQNNKVWAERYDKNPESGVVEYVKAKTTTLRSIEIPAGVKIRDVTVLGRDSTEGGTEYLNFNPYGGVERAVIHLTHEKRNWVFSLVTKPMTGRVAIYDKDVDINSVKLPGENNN